MTVVNLRSPFFVSVEEVGQTGSKVEVFIWAKGESVPALPQWTLEKDIPTATQIRNDYELSNKIRYSIEHLFPNFVTTPSEEDLTNFVNFRIKAYKYDAGYTLLVTSDYVAVNGYTDFQNGYNYTNGNSIQPLFNLDIIQTYARGTIPYVNVLFNHNGTDTITAEYTKLNDTYASSNNILTSANSADVYLMKIPITKSSTNYDLGNKVNIKVNGTITHRFTVMPVEIDKYTPTIVSFVNRFGGWQNMTFFKVRKDNISVEAKEYTQLQEPVNYSIYKGQRQVFDKNGKQSIKLNTGFVDENYDELIQDLLLSEVVLLDNLPVLVKTNSVEKFKHVNTKQINYTIDFENAFSLLNDVK